jgi:putative transposase
MSRNIIFSFGEFYHCYNRGVEKRNIFLNRNDYQRFISLLFVCNTNSVIHLSDHQDKSFSEIFEIERGDTLVEIGAYCLMTNHFHFLLKEKKDGNISIFMHKVLTAYTMYFNKKYNRTGSLFESTFKAKHANEDEYLKYLFSYIHLNPLKIIYPKWNEEGIKNIPEAKKFLLEYEYSSYIDYLSKERVQRVILNQSAFPDYFPDKKDTEEEISEWMTYSQCQG